MKRPKARHLKRVWFISRGLFAIVPLSQMIFSALNADPVAVLTWFAMFGVVLAMISNERNAYHAGYRFGNFMIIWAMSHDLGPGEFKDLPVPEPWDVPWQENPTHEGE